MGIIYIKNAPWTLIHEAYGIRLEGKYAGYESVLSPEIDRCITAIRVNGREIELGNHYIFAEDPTGHFINMESDKDMLCYYLSYTEMDDYDFEQFWIKEYHSYPWKHFAQGHKYREEVDERNRRALEARKAKAEAAIELFQSIANRRHQRLIIDGDTAYFVKIDKRRHKGADEVQDKTVLEFARQYPGNGIEIMEIREVV